MASYFDDFVDMGDTQPVKVDDLPDLYASISALSGLPPDIAGNAITSALKGEKEQNTATTPLTSALASLTLMTLQLVVLYLIWVYHLI